MSHIISKFNDFSTTEGVITYLNGCTIDFNYDNAPMIYQSLVDIANFNNIHNDVVADLYTRSCLYTAKHENELSRESIVYHIVKILAEFNKQKVSLDKIEEMVEKSINSAEKKYGKRIEELFTKKDLDSILYVYNHLNLIDKVKLAGCKNFSDVVDFFKEKISEKNKKANSKKKKSSEDAEDDKDEDQAKSKTKDKKEASVKKAEPIKLIEVITPEEAAKIEAEAIDAEFTDVDDKDEKLDANTVVPMHVDNDMLSDILNRIQDDQSTLLPHVSRAIALGVLASVDAVTINDIMDDITKHGGDSTTDTATIEIVNSITANFSVLGAIIPGNPIVPIEDCVSKDALVKIAVKVTDLCSEKSIKEHLNSLVDKIRAYEYKVKDNDTSTPITPIVFSNTKLDTNTSNEVTESKKNEIKAAFGKLLKNTKYELKKNGELITMYLPGVIVNNSVGTLTIDPNVVIGDGINIIAASPLGGSTAFNVAKNRDIVKKLLENPNYIMTKDEYLRSRKGQFVNDELYSVVDMSGMSKYVGQMSKEQKDMFEKRLQTIFMTPNPFFATFGTIPRFRFSIFKNVNEFTLVSDDKVKVPFVANNVVPGCVITVSEKSYNVQYNNNAVSIQF